MSNIIKGIINETKAKEKEADYGPEYQDMVRRVGQRAKELAGGSKTVWDEKTRRYKVVPANQVKEDAESLNIGDPVVITGDVQFNGATGDIVGFGKDNRFVIVDLYNHGKHSFHSSDVSFNDYADSDDEQEHMDSVREGRVKDALLKGTYHSKPEGEKTRSSGMFSGMMKAKDAIEKSKQSQKPNYNKTCDMCNRAGDTCTCESVNENIDTEELANEVYAEFEMMYPNLARRANQQTIHAAIMDVLNYGGDNNAGALAQDVARAVKQEMQQGVAEGSLTDTQQSYWDQVAKEKKNKERGSLKAKKAEYEKTPIGKAEKYWGQKGVAEDLPPPENARKTQIAGTLPTYKKAADILNKTGVQGKALDFGAGLGMGTGELGKDAHSYEPFPNEKFKPHFVDVTKIPDNSYHKIVNLNVLNVVPNTGDHKIRDSIVKNIGRVLAPGGVALITTRGKDVLTIKGTPGEEPMSMISKIGTYQKGFSQTELKQYIQSVLGDGFEVSSIKLGPAGVMIKKLDNQDVNEGWKDEADAHDEFLQHARQQLQNASVMERVRLAQRLSKLEQKHFPEMYSAESNGMSSSIAGIVNYIENGGRIPVKGGTVTQHPFGSVFSTLPPQPAASAPQQNNYDPRWRMTPEGKEWLAMAKEELENAFAESRHDFKQMAQALTHDQIEKFGKSVNGENLIKHPEFGFYVTTDVRKLMNQIDTDGIPGGYTPEEESIADLVDKYAVASDKEKKQLYKIFASNFGMSTKQAKAYLEYVMQTNRIIEPDEWKQMQGIEVTENSMENELNPIKPIDRKAWMQKVKMYYPDVQFIGSKMPNGPAKAMSGGVQVALFSPDEGIIKIVPPKTGSVASGTSLEEAGYGSNRGYRHGFASPTAPQLGRRGREDDEGNSEFDDKMRAITGMIFYNNVDDPEEAMAMGLKQTRTGKWFLRTGNRMAQKVADQRFGQGKVWYPKNESVAESWDSEDALSARISRSSIKEGIAGVEEGWSKKYKDSINCSNPKGFSQKAHCAGKKKTDEGMIEETYHGDEFYEAYGDLWYDEEQLNEAEYQGRKVSLGKPMRGDVKKFKVYVKDPSTGNIKKVNFGDPNMRIKKSNPGRRKSFRARHHCENPGPRTKARYWSCRKW